MINYIQGNRPKTLNPTQEAAINAFQDKIMKNIETFKEDNDKIKAQIQEVKRMSQAERRKSDFIQETLRQITGKSYFRKMEQNTNKNNQTNQLPFQLKSKTSYSVYQAYPVQTFQQIISNANNVQRPQQYSVHKNIYHGEFSQNQLLSKIIEAQNRAIHLKGQSKRLRMQVDFEQNLYRNPQIAALFQEGQELKSNVNRLIKIKKYKHNNNESNQAIKSPKYQPTKYSTYQNGKFKSVNSGKFDKYDHNKTYSYNSSKFISYQPKKFDKYDNYNSSKYDKYQYSKYQTKSKIEYSKYKQGSGNIKAASLSIPLKLNVTSEVSSISEVKNEPVKTEKSLKIDNQAILQDMKKIM